MNVATLEILEPGLMTTIQDKGRYGYQRFGVPVSGALDWFSLRAANRLIGECDDAAGLEITVVGPKIKFLTDTWIAMTGADLAPSIDGDPAPMWQSINVSEGSILSFNGAMNGLRSYLGVAGGIDVPLVMDSRSTYVKGAIGGMKGRALESGDVISTFVRDARSQFVERSLPEQHQPFYEHEHTVRVILGPQDDYFTSKGINTFLNSTYTVSIQSDRMGYRLEGPTIEHKAGSDILSDGTPLGAVQVPGDGQPIILLSDRGTTGGYTKIATVISSDIAKLAQAMPGDILTFQEIDVDTARSVLLEQSDSINSITNLAESTPATQELTITVDGKAFEIIDESGDLLSQPGSLTTNPIETHTADTVINNRHYSFEINVYEQGE